MADKVEKCCRERLFVHDSNHFPYSKKYYTTQEAHFFLEAVQVQDSQYIKHISEGQDVEGEIK